jgi:hypothetical protein
MAFDPQTRNRLARFVADARKLITDEFTQKFQSLYGLSPSGEISPLEDLRHLDEEQKATAERLRVRLRHLEPGARDTDRVKPDTVEQLIREQAFTVLNRLAAIRMAEKRGIIVESVGRGYESKGFKVYLQVAGNALGDTYNKYRRYLFCLLDELAFDLGTLFDRRSSAGLLFLREPALLQLLQLFNAPDLEPFWAEDETIGWIYQYYNDPAERRKMREQSAAPRNSRELAVRNQFFTPRYVVEFLTDNTLGRIWYEMTKGQTRLKEQCRYLVRRPNEIFLRDGETALESERPGNEDLSQEELLKEPVHIPHRPLKDPRSIRMLDPACGSMHFGLYAFDLFEVIYNEAWEIALGSDQALKSSAAFEPFVAFVAQYPDKAIFLREVPRLIIERNIHGIDIDPRCAQIAGLSLWLRAQRSWQGQRLQAAERPRIRRSNVVCAEPMPGEESFLNEFIEAQLSGTPEKNLLGELVRRVFEAMKLAGEAGSLLKIEEEIVDAVTEAKQKWLAGPKLEQGRLFADDVTPLEQKELGLDVAGITDDTFWERAEELIYAALQGYAEQVDRGNGYQRRLFADDAAQGFAFIDLCRKRYDVLVMNPPFGEPAKASKEYVVSNYPRTRSDVYAAFVERWLTRQVPGARLGAITSRTGFFLKTFQKWREEILLSEANPVVMADLGYGVLDAAMVEVAAYVVERGSRLDDFSCVRLVYEEDKAAVLSNSVLSLQEGSSRPIVFRTSASRLSLLPGAPFAYWISNRVLHAFAGIPALEDGGREAVIGASTKDDFRFLRLCFEVPLSNRATIDASNLVKHGAWIPFAKGGPTTPFHMNLHLSINWAANGAELKALISEYRGSRGWGYQWSAELKPRSFSFRPGLTWGRRSSALCFKVLPRNSMFADKGPAILVPTNEPEELLALLAVVSSTSFRLLVSVQLARVELAQSFEIGLIQQTPVPILDANDRRTLSKLALQAWVERRSIDTAESTSYAFVAPALLKVTGLTLAERAAAWQARLSASRAAAAALQAEIDEISFGLYGLNNADRSDADDSDLGPFDRGVENDAESEEAESPSIADSSDLVGELLAYAVGCAFGRWDVSFATGEKPMLELSDPFAPLPVCPPGQLQNEKGRPLTADEVRRLLDAGQWHYPLDLPWDGILVDDVGHPLDIEARIHQVLEIIWKDRWEAIEHQACQSLGEATLRAYFRRPAGFFADHLKRYSKSRRQAPIYWPLSTASGTYTLWIYYHRLTDQTLHTVLADFLGPKIKSVELDAQRQKEEGKTQKYGESIEFLDELKELRAEIERIIKLPWKPNLNDGVLITASPLWKFFRFGKWQKDLKACWEELERGDYDWAHLAYGIWPERVREKCKTDRSLAIAHGLEELCIVEGPKPKRGKTPKKKAAEEEGDKLLETEVDLDIAPKPAKELKANAVKDFEPRPIPIDRTERTDVLCTVRQLFSDGQTRDRDTAMHDVAGALGYQRVGPLIREILHKDLLTAVRRGILQNQNGQLSLVARDLRDYQRDFLKENFLGAIGRGWIERADAIQAFARWLGFSRTGSVIEETGYSLINGLLRDRRLEADKSQIRRAPG